VRSQRIDVIPFFQQATYLQLDTDHNGMLSKEELSQINKGTLTQLFLDRIFEEFRMYRSNDPPETSKMEMVGYDTTVG